MRASVPSLCFLFLLLSATVRAAPPASTAPAELRDDPRLAARLPVAAQDRPLGELLPALGAKLGLRLAARREVADDKATLLAADRPAAETLWLLARHLELQWYRVGGGYELGQSPEAARREQALRDREWEALQNWMEQLYRMSGISEERLLQREQEVKAALARREHSPAEHAALVREAAAILDLQRHSRAVPVTLAIYHSLTPPQLRQLRTEGSLRLSSAYGGLSPRLIQAAETALPPSRPDAAPLFVDALFRLTDEPREYERGGSRAPRQIRLETALTVAPEGGATMVNWAPRSLVDVPLPAVGPAVREDADARLDREITLSFPKPREPVAKAAVIRDHLGEWTPGTLRLGELARQVHDATGLDVISDSFIRARLLPRPAEKIPLRKLLDQVAAELGYAWWLEGRTLFLRSRSYYNDRPAEVPERVLRPWRKRVAGTRSPSLDDFGALAVPLTDAQALGLGNYWGWYLPEVAGPSFSGGFYRIRHDLRFWGSLGARQKAWVLGGNRLTADGMSLGQRRLFLLALTEPGDGSWTGDELRSTPPRPLEPSAANVPRWATFRLHTRKVELQVFQNGRGEHSTEIRSGDAPRALSGFDPPERYTPVGEATPGDNLTLVYDWSGTDAIGHSTQLYVFGE